MYLRELKTSAGMYISLLGKWLWVVIVQVVFALAGGIASVIGVFTIDVWVWIALFTGSIVISSFLAFHRLRVTFNPIVEAANISPSELLQRLKPEAKRMRAARKICAKAVKEAQALLDKERSLQNWRYNSLAMSFAKQAGRWANDTHRKLLALLPRVAANRFPDSSEMPAGFSATWYDVERELSTRISLLQEIMNDLSADSVNTKS